MKIHLWLGIIGGSFSYFLGILRSSLDMPEEHIRSQVQDQVIIRIDSDSVEDVNADDHDGTPGNGDDLVWQQLMDCIKALEKENETLVPMVCSHLDKHLKATVDSEFKDENQIPEPQVDPDVNLVMDELLPSGIITRLRDTVKLMMEAGFEEKCRDAYSNWRREFLEQCLSALGLQLQALDIENWIKTCKAAAKILFPNERRLCDYVFPMSSFAADVCFMKVCEELMICLLSFADTIITTGSYLPNLLFNIIPQMSKSLHELDRVLESAYKKDFMWLEAYTKMVQKRFDILKKFANVVYRDSDTQATVASGGLHPFTLQVMNYIHSILPPLRGSVQGYRMIPGREGKKSSFSQLLARMIELLESNLEAKSRDYTDPALAYLFMMNNLRHIGQEVYTWSGTTIFDYYWFGQHATKVEHNLKLFQRHSWDKMLDFLKLEQYESVAPNVVAESMKDKPNLFFQNFEEICKVQSTWIVSDTQLRKRIIKSIYSVLLPAYGEFTNRFRDVFGKHADEYIEYGIVQIENGLSHLFLVRDPMLEYV